MKKWQVIIAAALLGLAVAGCTKSAQETEATPQPKVSKIVIGASNVPHAEILEFIKPELLTQGVNLEIKVFNDYILPNKTLADGDLDANFFQHVPYFERAARENPEYKFTNLGGVHLEPIGFYSKRHKSLAELPDGALITVSNNLADHGRVLNVLQQNGLVKINPAVDVVKATPSDIIENPKNLKFKLDIEPALMPQVYNYDEADVVVINANFALSAGLNPVKDPFLVENAKNNPYVNIIVVRTADKERTEFAKLMQVLQADSTVDFIINKYQGTVIPAK